MAATFTQAVVAVYNGLANMPDLWSEEIADSVTVYPRAELRHMGETPVYNNDGETVVKWDARCEISLFDVTLEGAESLATTVAAALTPSSLSITGKTNRLFPPIYKLGIQRERTTDQYPVFMANLEYLCEISKG